MLGALWLLSLCVVSVIALWSGETLLTLTSVLALLISGSLPLWRRYCLTNVSYSRSLGTTRAEFGEIVTLVVSITNLKLLPLSWLRITDSVPDGVRIEGGAAVQEDRSAQGHVFTMLFAILPYQRVTRRLRIHCMRRGDLAFGPTILESGDLLGTLARQQRLEAVDRLLVYPKMIRLHLGRLPSNQILGRDAAHRSLLTDPLRPIGAREYRSGDPYRSIDWRSSARFDTLMVHEWEPSATPVLHLILNLEGLNVSVPAWEADATEFAISLAASLARYGAERRWAIGLCANGHGGGIQIALAPSANPRQFPAILELLARADSNPAASVTSLLTQSSRSVPVGTALVVITTTVDNRLRHTVRDLHRRGWQVLIMSVAPENLTTPVERIPLIQVPYDAGWKERDALVLGN
jgi:uncharacterized protein (DUF58 family)